MRRNDLVEITLRLSSASEAIPVRIAEIDVDENAAPSLGISLYRLSSVGTTIGLGRPVPARYRAVVVSVFRWRMKGRIHFVCTSGAAGKCVLMGYRPWDTADEPPLRALHRACVHMRRADYGGDDRPTTRNGTAVDIYDRFGIQVPAMRDDMRFEAAWGEDGAVCVTHPRIADNLTLAELLDRHERFAGRLLPEACSEDAMRQIPNALLFNRSIASE